MSKPLNHQQFMKTKIFNLSLIIWVSLFSLACQPKQNIDVRSSNSLNPYLFAYTSGIISNGDAIVIEFTDDMIKSDDIGSEAKVSWLNITPKIDGALSWDNTRTLRLDPNENLPSGQTYQARLQVGKIVKSAKGDDATFNFEFRTKDQNLAVEIDNLKASKNDDLSVQELYGTVFTADIAAPEAIEGLLKAQQNGKALEVDWEHGDGMTHQFIVKGISRSQNPSEVAITWNGKNIQVKEQGQEKIEIPALGDFKVMEAQVLHDPEQYILLQFSDPLQKRQDLSGLVGLSNYQGDLRFAINDNEIRVYPNQRLAGAYQLTLNPGIKNISGARMKGNGKWDMVFEEVKPKVRLVGNGVIMPNTDGLLFPFEAIGLNAVELEVFKIYNNNILQFLQSNQINGMYDLNTVGRIILQKKIDLQSLNPNSNNQRWMRYAMDLSTLFEQDPEAIYQIRLGFRPSYSTLVCEDASALEASQTPEYEEEDEIRSVMDSWYGVNGYYPGYDYDNRDNPCYPEYYNSEKFVRRNIVSSNLGIITKMGQNQDLIAIVSDLRTAAPMANSTVEVYDYQQQLIGEGKTDGNGFAKITVEGKPFVCVAKQGKDVGYLRLQDGDALSVSRFNVSGARTQKGLKGYIYGERGVWRPGDSIFLNFVLDDRANELPKDYPITMEVYDSRGQLHAKRMLAYNIDQVYPMFLATEKDAPTGNWSANVKVGGANFRKTIKVETVKPNRIEIDVDFGAKELTGRNEIDGAVAANWLIGTPASGLKAVVEAQLRPTTTKFEDYPAYIFDDPARAYRNTSTKVLFDGTLNESGEANFSSQLLGAQSVPGKMKTNIRTRVFEKGGDFSTDAFTIDYSPFDAYTGVEIPKNKYDEPRLEVGENGRLQFVSVDQAGKPLANRKLSVGFYRVSWRWWWDQGNDYVSNYNTTTHNNAKARTELTTNSSGAASWTIKPEEWGRYLIRVCDLDGGHCSGSYVYAGYPWYGDDNNSREVAAMLNFKADKDQYTVGETVKLTIPSGKEGRALVTLESGSQVVDRFWVDAKEGENELTFSTTADMAPTVYANVSMIQPHGQMDNDLPIRMYGVVPINVEDPQTILKPMLDMPNELRPEQTFTVEINEASKQEMTYTLAVVDEGLLGLTRFKTPNPHDAFYAREALGVKTWDIYDNVLGAYGGELDRVLSIGGDDEASSDDVDNTANRFEPVVRHLGPFKLEKGKKNKHEITLPNYVGAVRVMAVAASSNGSYGSVDKRVRVSNPLMVLSTLPRVLSPGDELKLPVNVFVTNDKVKRVKVSLKEASGLIDLGRSTNNNLTFDGEGNQLTEFSIKVKDGVGVARFEITASGNGETASQTIEIQVRNPNPYQNEVFATVVDPGKDWSQTFAALGMQGTNEAVLEISSIPPINLGRRLKYLLRYPYGCVEQTTSAAFPQLFVNKLIDLDEEQKTKIPNNIRGAIKRLQQFQTSNGGLAYWPGSSSPNQWGTNYAMHFLLEAKMQGYQVSSSFLSKLVKFQKKTAKLWSPKQADYGFYSSSSQQLDQAYRLYTLALSGEPDLSSMNRLRERDDLKLQARWRLAAAYALIGKDNIAKELTNGQSTVVEEYQELSYTYGSSIRDQAMILETTVLMEDDELAGQMVQDLSKNLSSQRWLSTQTTAYSLLSIAKFVGITETNDAFNFSYQVASSRSQDVKSETPVMQIDLGDLKESGNEVSFRNKSNGKLFARLIVSGQPRPGLEKGSSNDLEMSVRFLNTDGTTLDPSRLPQGKDFIAEVKVTHPNTRLIRYEELALSQAFPSGWEILNSRMDGMSNGKQSYFEYRDVRDDRVDTFFDLNQKKTSTFRVQVNSAYKGRFYLPATACQAMYDNTISAFRAGQWVEVVGADNS